MNKIINKFKIKFALLVFFLLFFTFVIDLKFVEAAGNYDITGNFCVGSSYFYLITSDPSGVDILVHRTRTQSGSSVV